MSCAEQAVFPFILAGGIIAFALIMFESGKRSIKNRRIK